MDTYFLIRVLDQNRELLSFGPYADLNSAVKMLIDCAREIIQSYYPNQNTYLISIDECRFENNMWIVLQNKISEEVKR